MSILGQRGSPEATVQPTGSDGEKPRHFYRNAVRPKIHTYRPRGSGGFSRRKVTFLISHFLPSFSAPIEKLPKHANAMPQRSPAHRPFDRMQTSSNPSEAGNACPSQIALSPVHPEVLNNW